MTTSSPCSCVICRKLTSNLGLSAHIGFKHSGDDSIFHKTRQKANASRKGVPSWNAGKSLSDEHKRNLSDAGLCHEVLPETRVKISKTAKSNGKSGGVREGGGRGKKGRYSGIYCDSTWELAFVICAIADGKNIKRVSQPRVYTFEGRERKYFPDFIVDGKVFEIKGWKTPQSIAKEEQNPDIIVVQWNEIKPMMERAKIIIGDDIINAYE